jgi:hypothetical protein
MNCILFGICCDQKTPPTPPGIIFNQLSPPLGKSVKNVNPREWIIGNKDIKLKYYSKKKKKIKILYYKYFYLNIKI